MKIKVTVTSNDLRVLDPTAEMLMESIAEKFNTGLEMENGEAGTSITSNARPAGPYHQVVTVTGLNRGYRKTPCGGCPWRLDNDRSFPAEAFLHSANTAHDMATHEFACHESGIKGCHTCAGFILNGSDHNLASRLKRMKGEYQDVGTTVALHESYRAMAEANGVDPAHPNLQACRQ